MQLGMIGLGRMGANMTRRLMKDGHDLVVYDVSADTVSQLKSEGATGSGSLEELVTKLEAPRTVWVMVPAALVGKVIDELVEHLEPGDAIIDGGNSYYRDDVDRAKALLPRGIHFVDVGTSGGVFGLERGFCLMIGGENEVVERLEPIFASLAPGVDSAPRTDGKSGDPSPAEQGYLHCGPNGAGHFVKMVHNGIEYGIMAAYAEGLNVLHKADAGKHDDRSERRDHADARARVLPVRHPVPDVAEVWRRGSVVASWLLDLTAHALSESPGLDDFGGFVSDSGEGRWTVLAAVEEGVPVPVLSSALFERFSSRGRGAVRRQAALRHAQGVRRPHRAGHPQLILAGDIGGTNTRLALFDGDPRSPVALEIYPSNAHSSLEEVLRAFLAMHPERPEAAAFGIAGPVRDGRVQVTNLAWPVDATILGMTLGLDQVLLLNDLEANAWGLAALGDDDFHVLNEGRPGATGNAAVCSAGTGLGEAGLYWDGSRHHPFACEGGHTDFAPFDERQEGLRDFLASQYAHVSYERVCSGIGLVNIYRYLAGTCELKAAEISRLALARGTARQWPRST